MTDSAENRTHWYDDFGKAVLLPFVTSRIGLLLIFWLAPLLQGGTTTPFWTRLQHWFFNWDAAWYMSVVRYGYRPAVDLTTTNSNVVFFPLFPFTMRLVSFLLPAAWRTSEQLFVVGAICSNLFFLAALTLIYQLILAIGERREVAQRTIWYIVIFPTSFYFSLFYTESTYLLFVALSLTMMWRKNWWLASLAGAMVALCRPPGVLIAASLGWQYMADRSWNFRKIDAQIIWLGLIPLATIVYFLAQSTYSGDLLGPVTAQAAWSRNDGTIWQAWRETANLEGVGLYVTRLDQIVLLIFIVLGVYAIWKVPTSIGLFSGLQLVPQILSGSFTSSMRYCVVLFPVMLIWAMWGERRWFHAIYLYVMVILQAILLAHWLAGGWVA